MAAGQSSASVLGCLLLFLHLFYLEHVICIEHHHEHPHQMYESGGFDYQQQQKLLNMPNVVGAKLVGIFEDDHKDENTAAKETVMKRSGMLHNSNHKHNYTYWPHHLNLEKRHFCEEVIFEETGLRFVTSTKPTCMLGHDHDDEKHLKNAKRQKRDINTVCGFCRVDL